MKVSDTLALFYGAVAVIFLLVMNSPPVLTLTEGYEVVHLVVIAFALYMLALSPFELLHVKLIRASDCSRLLRAQAFGVLGGSILIIPLLILVGLEGFLLHAVQLIVTYSLSLFIMFHDFTFSNMFAELSESGSSRKRWGPDLLSQKGFSRMLLAANIYPVVPIGALIASSQFVLSFLILAFQGGSSLIGLGLHSLSLKWSQGSVSPAGPASQ